MSVTIESQSSESTNSADLDPIFPDLTDFPGDQSFLHSILEILLSYIFEPNVVKYGIRSNNMQAQ